MKSKITKILGLALTVTILASLLVTMAASPAMAGDRKWTKANLPAQGADGDWFWDHDLQGLGPVAMTIETSPATLIVYANHFTLGHILLKSDDGGMTWSRLKKYTTVGGGMVVDFATDPTDADTFYVLDNAGMVWRTNDMGVNFVSITNMGLGGDTLTSIDFNWVGGNAYLFAGGGTDVYRFDEYEYGATWQSMGLDAYSGLTVNNTLDVRTAPDFSESTSPMVMCIWEDGANTFIDYKYGSSDWGTVTGQVTLVGVGAATRGRFNENFPADFSSDNASGLLEYFVAIDDAGFGNGGIYRIVVANNWERTGNVDDFCSVDFAGNVGNGTIIAGTTAGAARPGDVYRATDGVGGTWAWTQKAPDGMGDAWVLADDDLLENDLAYCALNGCGGAFSRQVRDRQWLAYSLIDSINDSTIDQDFANSYRYLVTQDRTGSGCWTGDELYRHDGERWVRLVRTNGNNLIDGIFVSDEFNTDETLFYWDDMTIFRSTNAGDRFIAQLSAAADYITGAHAFDSSHMVIATDSNGTYYTGNNGTTWGNNATAVISGQHNTASVTEPASFAVDPTDNEHVLIGAGQSAPARVYESTNQGKGWTAVAGSSYGLGTGETHVAFDPVDPNNFFAAGVSGGNLIVQRNTDGSWTTISGGLPVVPTQGATGLVAIEGGCGVALYVSDNQASGVFRTLNPLAGTAGNVAWEQANNNIGVELRDLMGMTGSIELYGIDATNQMPPATSTDVWTFNDTLAYPIENPSVTDDAATGTARVSWDAMDGATTYQVQLADRDDFKTGIVATNTPAGTSTTFAGLMPGTDYWVRIRVAMGSPLLSCWSETVSFQTGMGPSAWNPFVVSGLVAPAPGDKDVDPIQPLFQWNPADDAASYEFQLADNAAFAGADTKVVKSPAYEWPGDLEYGKTYYWRVRSIKANGATSEWAMGIFTTAEEPVPEEPPVVVAPPQPAPPPQYIPTTYIPEYILWTIVGIGGLLIIALIILIMKTRRVA
jgi:hypothetical protein